MKRARPGKALLLIAGLLALMLVTDGPATAVQDAALRGGRHRDVGQGSAVPAAVAPSPSPRKLRVRKGVPRVGATSVILEDLSTGRIVFERRADERLPIASLTKIMTAMLVLKATRPSERVRVSRKAAAQEPTSLGLRAGQRISVANLMWGLLLHSANDAAVALAEHVGGTVRAFDALMNRRAAALGMGETRFASPNGLNDRGYSTARDVATLTGWAFRSPAFDRLVGTKRRRIVLSGKRVVLRNLNDLLWTYRGALGVKTGYTTKAGWCLAAIARRRDATLLEVLLHDRREPFADGAALLDYGFRVAGTFGIGVKADR